MNGIALQLAECKRILLTVKLCNTTVWRKAVRWGFSSHYKCLTDLLREADLHLFRKMTSNSGHCIHQLLPPTKVLPMKLRDSHCVYYLLMLCYAFNLLMAFDRLLLKGLLTYLPKLSNGTIFNNLEWPLIQISRTRWIFDAKYDLRMPYSRVSFRMTLSDLVWFSEIFDDT